MLPHLSGPLHGDGGIYASMARCLPARPQHPYLYHSIKEDVLTAVDQSLHCRTHHLPQRPHPHEDIRQRRRCPRYRRGPHRRRRRPHPARRLPRQGWDDLIARRTRGLLAEGITAVHDAAASPAAIAAYRRLAAAGRLPISVLALPYSNELLRNPGPGIVEDLTEDVRAVTERGFPTAIHANGNGGLDAALTAIETASRAAPDRAPPPRAEHLVVMAPVRPGASPEPAPSSLSATRLSRPAATSAIPSPRSPSGPPPQRSPSAP